MHKNPVYTPSTLLKSSILVTAVSTLCFFAVNYTSKSTQDQMNNSAFIRPDSIPTKISGVRHLQGYLHNLLVINNHPTVYNDAQYTTLQISMPTTSGSNIEAIVEHLNTIEGVYARYQDDKTFTAGLVGEEPVSREQSFYGSASSGSFGSNGSHK